MNRLQHLQDAGVSIWLDDLSRELIESGELMRLIQERAVTGATSNPAIFERAITNSERYDDELSDALKTGFSDPREIFFELALEDVRRGADALRAVHELTDGHDGFDELADEDVDFDALTAELERQGVQSFRESYRDLLDSIEARAFRLMGEVGDYARI